MNTLTEQLHLNITFKIPHLFVFFPVIKINTLIIYFKYSMFSQHLLLGKILTEKIYFFITNNIFFSYIYNFVINKLFTLKLNIINKNV